MSEAPSADPLQSYEINFTCDLLHSGHECDRLAEFTAKMHKCTNGKYQPEGRNLLVCKFVVDELIGLTYPFRCKKCNHAFGSFVDYVWDIRWLRVTQ